MNAQVIGEAVDVFAIVVYTFCKLVRNVALHFFRILSVGFDEVIDLLFGKAEGLGYFADKCLLLEL